jgi:hypothetical protein
MDVSRWAIDTGVRSLSRAILNQLNAINGMRRAVPTANICASNHVGRHRRIVFSDWEPSLPTAD